MKKLIILFILALNFTVFPAFAFTSLNDINQKVCTRFEEDLSRLAAIMEEVKNRQGITETRVAFGNVDSPIEKADYWITFAAEASAYQRAQKFSTENQLRASLQTLKAKVLRAKTEVGKALDDN